MKILILFIGLTFSFSSYAGPGHGHSHEASALTAKQAEKAGKFHVNRLVESKKIDESWRKALFDKAEQKLFANKTEWVVTFNNHKSIKEKKLYIFLTTGGQFVAANFTGK